MATTLNLQPLRAIIAGLDDAIDQGAHNAAELVGDLAQQLAPEDTGALKRSKTVVRSRGQRLWRVAFTAPYAAYVEYGTRHSPAQPYLTPAMRQIDVGLEIAKEVKALIRRSAR